MGCRGTDVQPQYSRAELMDPKTCGNCHEQHYKDWSGSMHAYAAIDPVFIAMNQRAQRETNGEVGSLCVGCHAPMAVREGLTADGLNLQDVPQHLQGVTCYFCHTVEGVEGTHNNPLRLSGGIEMRAGIKDPIANTGHYSTYSVLHDRDQAASSSMCGSCHDIAIHQKVFEKTFIEWQASVFAKPGGATCSQCHMSQSLDERPIANHPSAPPRRYHSHTFAAIDVALVPDFPEQDNQRKEVEASLATTLQSALCVAPVSGGSGSTIRVILDNVAAGHGFPSGATPNRRIWTDIRAYKNGEVIYESGVKGDKPLIETADADTWLFRDCLFDAQGTQTSMLWNAFDHEGHQLPAQFTFDVSDPRFYQGHLEQSFPRNRNTFLTGMPDKVILKIRVQPVGDDLLNDLVQSGDLSAEIVQKMPIFDIDLGAGQELVWTQDDINGRYIENGILSFGCVTRSNLDVTTAKTRALESTRCKP